VFELDLIARAEALLTAYRERGWQLATVESCTGGLIAGLLTEIAGSSAVVERGFVTYSNAAKTELVGVPSALIAAQGAVSREVAEAMASGAIAAAPVEIAVSVTGIAGPGGATPAKPVGLVCFGLARRGRAVVSEQEVFDGDRHGIRIATVGHALALLERPLSAG